MKKNAYVKMFAVLCLIFMTAATLHAQKLRSSEERITTEKWAMRLNPGQNPDELAKEIGAENLGQIGSLPDTYLFRLPGTLAKSTSLTIESHLQKESRVKWHQQQVSRWRFPRSSFSNLQFSDPSLLEQWHLENTGQTGGKPGEDVNVASVWEKGITGKGVVIGVVDDGLQYQHPDIALNYQAELSYDFNYDDNDPAPNTGSWYEDDHGTSVAGVAAARDNYTCGRGVAYRAGLAGLRLISTSNTDAEEAQCLSYKRDNIHIYTNSWGPDDDGKRLEGPEPLAAAVLEESIKKGRGGLGTIYVWAAGNGKRSNDNVNYDGYANSRFTIAVGAVDHKGIQSSYSEPGAAMLVTAPSDGDGVDITTTDLLGADGGSDGDCRSDFGGTSASAPIAAGVIALMLEVNPNLTWRDVQHILAQSAVQNAPSDADWTVNGAGFHINHKYGFGRIDADTAVKSASSWRQVPEVLDLSYGPETVNQAIPDNSTVGVVSTIHVDKDIKLEHAEVVLNATHRYRGNLKIVLTSPSGTQSILAESRSDRNADYDGWKFMTVRSWGESSAGDWKLTVADTVLSNTGTFDSWELILHGTSEPVNHPPRLNADNVDTDKDAGVVISVLANDSDGDGDALSVISVSNPAHGAVVLNADNTLTYTPETGFTGTDSFTYSARDKAVSSTADVTVLVGKLCEAFSAETQTSITDGSSLSSSLQINTAGLINDVNLTLNIRHPSLADIEVALISPIGTRVVMVRNISGKDLTDTTLDDEAASALSEGSAPFQGLYRPSELLSRFDGEFLIGEWKLQVTDTAENTNEGTLEAWKLEVCYFPLSENYPPAALDDMAVTKKEAPVTIHVLDNDRDPNGDALTVTGISEPDHGIVTAGSDNTVEYTPEIGFTGTDSFIYTVSDAKGKTATATVSVTVAMQFALQFDGADDYVDCGNGKTLNLTGTLTIEAWINPSGWGEYGDAGFGRIVDKGKFVLFINNTNPDIYNDQSLVFRLEHADGVFSTFNTPADSIRLNEWQYMAVTYDGVSSVRIYINGQEQTLGQISRLPSGPLADSSDYDLFIGDSAEKDRAFKGLIDEVRIWGAARTPEEIKSFMNTELTGIEKGLAAYWPILENSTLTDRSGNGNDGEIVGAVWAEGASLQEVLSPLANVILGLKVLSGETPEGTAGITDINNGGTIDMPDVIYILRELSRANASSVMY